MNATCIVVDLGGTFLRCGLIAEDEALVAVERFRLPGDASSRTETIWPQIVDAIAGYAARHRAKMSLSAPIAFAFPGPIASGRVTVAPTVRGGSFALPDIRAMLADRTRRDVALINDVSAAAWYFGGRFTAERFVVVTISSGVGAKIFDRRHPLGVLDDVPSAGEIGHLVVDPRRAAPLCDCGGRGHLGTFASARGFERGARLAATRDLNAFAHSAAALQFGATTATLNNEAHLVPAVQADDPWSLSLLRESIRPLAIVVRTLCVGSGLDGIVLMGGFVQALGERYRVPFEEAMFSHSDVGPARTNGQMSIVITRPGEEPSLSGAAAFLRRKAFAA